MQEMMIMEKTLNKEKKFKRTRIIERLNSYIKESEQEYNSYKKTKDTTKLAEAGEKLWGAFNYLIELKANKSLNTTSQVRSEVYLTHDGTLIGIYDRAFSLHQFFYGLVDRIEDITERYESVLNGLKVYKAQFK